MDKPEAPPQQAFYPTRDAFLNDIDWENSNDYLGGGTYGKVFRMRSKKSDGLLQENQYYAVKYIEATNQQVFQKIQNEFKINSLISRHPNIIQVIKVYAWQELLPMKYVLVLVMELADRSLQKEIEARKQQNQPFKDEELLSIFYQSFTAFSDLVSQNAIFHRDVKPENILLARPESLEVKVTDFGVSKTLYKQKITQSLTNTLVGTPVYLSPRLWDVFILRKENIKVNSVKHDLEKSDIFSLGITFLQCALLLTTEIVGLNQKNGQEKINRLLSQIQNEKIRNILARMLDHNERSRFTYSQLLQTFFNPKQPQSENRIFDFSLERKRSASPMSKYKQLESTASIQSFQVRSGTGTVATTNEIRCEIHKDQTVKYFCYVLDSSGYKCIKCLSLLQPDYQQFYIQLPEQQKMTMSIEVHGIDLLSTFECKENIEIDLYNYLREQFHLAFIDAVKSQVDHHRLIADSNPSAQAQTQILLNEKIQRIKSIIFAYSKGDRRQCADVQMELIQKLDLTLDIKELINNLQSIQSKNQRQQFVDQFSSSPLWTLKLQQKFDELLNGNMDSISTRYTHMENTVKEVDFVKSRKKIFESSPKKINELIIIGAKLTVAREKIEGKLSLVTLNGYRLIWVVHSNVIYEEDLTTQQVASRVLKGKEITTLGVYEAQTVVGCRDGSIVFLDDERVSSKVQSSISCLSCGDLGLLSGHHDGKIYNHTKEKEITRGHGPISSIIQYKHSYVFTVYQSKKIYYYTSKKMIATIDTNYVINQVLRIDPYKFLTYGMNEPVARVWNINEKTEVSLSHIIELSFSPSSLIIQQDQSIIYTNGYHLVKVDSRQPQSIINTPGYARGELFSNGPIIGVRIGESLTLYK